MPHFPETTGMTKEERFTSVTVYLAKIADHLQGVPDEYLYPIPRPHSRRAAGRAGSAVVQVKIYYLISRKQFPHLRLGKNVRVRESDLQKWLSQRIEAHTT